MFKVIEILEWPNLYCKSLASMPAYSMIVACVCLKLWNPILGTPACLKRVFKRVDSVLLFGY